MGVVKKRPKRIPYTVRADIRKLDERIRQIEFLQKEDITTRDQLSAYRKPLQEQVTELLKERRKLYRSEPESKRLGEITMQLKELRGKIKLTVQIEKHSLEIEERLRAVEEQEKQTVELQKRHREEKDRT